jgi:hypothetical protein
MSISVERKLEVQMLASKLVSNREIAKTLHISRSNVALILKDFVRPLCACGRVGEHLGWCASRVEASESRQTFMTNNGRCRTLRRTLKTSGHGGVAVETTVIKAPPKQKPLTEPSDSDGFRQPVTEEVKEAPLAKQTTPFRMFNYASPPASVRVSNYRPSSRT